MTRIILLVKRFLEPKELKELRRAWRALDAFHEQHGRRHFFVRGRHVKRVEEHLLDSEQKRMFKEVRARVFYWQNKVPLSRRGGRHEY